MVFSVSLIFLISEGPFDLNALLRKLNGVEESWVLEGILILHIATVFGHWNFSCPGLTKFKASIKETQKNAKKVWILFLSPCDNILYWSISRIQTLWLNPCLYRIYNHLQLWWKYLLCGKLATMRLASHLSRHLLESNLCSTGTKL